VTTKVLTSERKRIILNSDVEADLACK